MKFALAKGWHFEFFNFSHFYNGNKLTSSIKTFFYVCVFYSLIDAYLQFLLNLPLLNLIQELNKQKKQLLMFNECLYIW